MAASAATAGASDSLDGASFDRTTMAGAEAALSYLQAKNLEALKMRTQSRVFAQDQMDHYLARLGLCLDGLNVIHVAGSKGKGSTCAFAESILHAQGLRTGLYTSPHLVSLAERFRLDTEPVSEPLFLTHFWRVWDGLWTTRAQCGPHPPMPAYFAFLTLVGFDLYLAARVDMLVLEVGLGGKLDATNVVRRPLATAVTTLALEHTEILGDTYSLIAREKAGIFKPAVPAFTVPQVAEALHALEAVAAEVGAPLIVAKKLVLPAATEEKGGERTGPSALSLAGTSSSSSFPLTLASSAVLGLAGDHQRLNAGLAVQLVASALDTLRARGQLPAVLAKRLHQQQRSRSQAEAGGDAAAEALVSVKPHVVRFPGQGKADAVAPIAAFNTLSAPTSDAARAGAAAAAVGTTGEAAAAESGAPRPLVVTPHWSLLPPSYRRGLAATAWAGRCQVVACPELPNLTFYLDGAHTGPSIELCAEWYRGAVAAAAASATTSAAGSGAATSSARGVDVLVFNCGHVRNPFSLLEPLVAAGIEQSSSSFSSSSAPAPASLPSSGDRQSPPPSPSLAPAPAPHPPLRFAEVLLQPFDHDRLYLGSPPPLAQLARANARPLSPAALDLEARFGAADAPTGAAAPAGAGAAAAGVAGAGGAAPDPALQWQRTLLGTWDSLVFAHTRGADAPAATAAAASASSTVAPASSASTLSSTSSLGHGGYRYSATVSPAVSESIKRLRVLARAQPAVPVRALVTGSLYLVGNVLKALQSRAAP